MGSASPDERESRRHSAEKGERQRLENRKKRGHRFSGKQQFSLGGKSLRHFRSRDQLHWNNRVMTLGANDNRGYVGSQAVLAA